MSKVIGICKNEHCEYCEFQVQQEVDQENPICQGCGELLELVENGKRKDIVEKDDGKRKKIWKRIFLILATILLLGGIVFGVVTFVKRGSNPPPPIDHPITPDSITLNKISWEFDSTGESEKLIATVYPDSVPEKNKKVIWKSGEETVAKVDSNGVVTAVADNGSAVISAYTGNGLSATCYVTVGKVIAVDSVTLDKTATIIGIGNSIKPYYAILPKDATNTKITWQSGDSTIATVDSTGSVKAIAEGKANITVTTVDGNKTATCKVTVVKGSDYEKKRIYGTISVHGGIYKGYLLNGKPDGEGTIRYNSHTLIDSRDLKKRYAEAGQRITGQFENGHLLQGKLFNSEEVQIGTIIP